MPKLFLFLVFVLACPVAHALPEFTLGIGSITTPRWNVQGIHIGLTDPAQAPQKLVLTIDKLSLPKPFHDLTLVNIRCDDFSWQGKELMCRQGLANLQSKYWQSPNARFTLTIKQDHSTLKLSDLQLAGGTITVNAVQQGDDWQMQANVKAVDSTRLQPLLPTTLELTEGLISINLKASGNNTQTAALTLSADINGLTGQTKDGRFATEKLTVATKLKARDDNGLWHWQSETRLKKGALYAEPIYLETDRQNISLTATGDWHIAQQSVAITSAQLRHPQIATLKGNALIRYKKKLDIAKAQLSLHSADLQQLSAIYLKPLFEQTALDGLSAAGQLKADLTIRANALSALTATVNKLAIHDTASRISLEDGAGTVFWSDDNAFATPSHVAWQTLKLGPLPIGASALAFLTRAKTLRLLKKTTLPFLGGTIDIDQFGWQAKAAQEPDVYFVGKLTDVSLKQLSQTLNWTPLSGSIGGTIPKVEYRNKTLSLDGEIDIHAFDGVVKITNLASSGLFSAFPKLYGELEIDRIDLDLLTQKLKFGGITGKLSGFVRQLYLENWRPVTFFAWLGTPDDDDSKHRISQKAVKNIASIGGGAAADLLSKGFLSIFETFGYDKIGLGCYLHEGVCQLSGVEAAPQGYVIIKGGGLPRIDVIGYNPRVDWAVLMERLGRISTTDEVIIK